MDPSKSTELAEFILSIQQPFWEPIGRFVFNFGLLERLIDERLSELMDIEYVDHGMYALSTMDLLTRANLLRVYCRKDDPAPQAEMKTIYLELEELNTFRNNLVHGPWTSYMQTDPDEGSSWQKTRVSRRFKTQFFDVRRDQINDKTTAIEGIKTRLTRLCRQLTEARKRGAPTPSPERS